LSGEQEVPRCGASLVRRCSSPVFVAFALALAPVAAASLARAAGDEEPIRLEYAAAPECESRDELAREIVNRAPRARLARDGEPARHFEVRIAHEGPTYRVDLVIRGGDGSAVSRRLSADSCPQATRALALMIALSVDPRASTAEASGLASASTSASDPGSESRSGSPSAQPPDAAASPPDDPASPASKTPLRLPERIDAPPGGPARARRRWSLALGPDAALLLLISSRPVLALGGHVEVARAGGPSLRATLFRGLSQTISEGGLGGDFDWTWGRVDACPFAFGGAILDFRPCAFAELGQLNAAGTGGSSTVQRGRPWVTVGLLTRLAAHLGIFRGSLDVGLASTMNRESFVFVPSPVVYQIPAWIPSAGISLGAAWTP